MNLKHGSIKSFSLFAGVLCLTLIHSAYATSVSGLSITNTDIASELTNATNGTTVQFTMDANVDQVAVDFFQVSPVDSTLTKVATRTKSYLNTDPRNQTIFWNALWLIGVDFGRRDGTFAYQVTPSTGGTLGTAEPPSGDSSSIFHITSVDIHNLTVTPSIDSNQLPTFPYKITYALAKQSIVTVQIYSSSGTDKTLVRTVFTGQQPPETISTATVTWDGLKEHGTPAPIGIYISSVSAIDPGSKERAIPRTATFGLTSLAGGAITDPQKLFESNVYVYPNPVRNGLALFNVLPVRDGATIHLRIYTITGTLVLDQDITANLPFKWNATNQAGSKVGRGLYYYVMRENDSQGTLQVTKKMVVLP